MVHIHLDTTAIIGMFCRYRQMVYKWYDLLPWTLSYQQVLITLLFEGIGILFLVHTFLEATAISGISCCHGHLVILATEAGAYNIAV